MLFDDVMIKNTICTLFMISGNFKIVIIVITLVVKHGYYTLTVQLALAVKDQNLEF